MTTTVADTELTARHRDASPARLALARAVTADDPGTAREEAGIARALVFREKTAGTTSATSSTGSAPATGPRRWRTPSGAARSSWAEARDPGQRPRTDRSSQALVNAPRGSSCSTSRTKSACRS